MKCPKGREGDSHQVQITLVFPPRDQMGHSWLAPSPSCHSFPPAKDYNSPVSDPKLPAIPLRGSVPTVQQPPTLTPPIQRCLVPHRGFRANTDKGMRPLLFTKKHPGSRAAVPRAQPHSDRKPFTFSKNTGLKVRRPQRLLLCQQSQEAGKSVRNLVQLIWLHFLYLLK